MAGLLARALRLAARRSPPPPLPILSALLRRPLWLPSAVASPLASSLLLPSRISEGGYLPSPRDSCFTGALGVLFVGASRRWYRKVRRSPRVRPRRTKEKPLELDVEICIEEELPEDPQLLSIAETLQMDVARAIKVAFDDIKDSEYKFRDKCIDDVDKYEKVELSLLLCNDKFIRKLNKEWRDEDRATDVLSMSQHVPELNMPTLLLGDIVISVETATHQAEERGHELLDEIRILMAHGLLHLLGFDHEIGGEAESEMRTAEENILRSLGWKGKGLINSAQDAVADESPSAENFADITKMARKESSIECHKSKLSYIFCDLDGILNSKNEITTRTVEDLIEAASRGVKMVIVTGKTRSGIIRALEIVGFAEKVGVVSESSPGVFLQGSLVYGREGQEIFKAELDQDVCRKACLYSLEHEVPLVAFCGEHCLALFEHPLIESLHTIHHEPKAEIMPSVEHILAYSSIQKLIFLYTADGVFSVLHPYWSEALKGRACIVQEMPDMLEIVPPGISKGSGAKLLLDHLGITEKE
ncbi:Endoribonuclease YbeY, partial [Ananas comosus]